MAHPVEVFIFFFSSRRRHTRSKRDWSSDVCSSDLFFTSGAAPGLAIGPEGLIPGRAEFRGERFAVAPAMRGPRLVRSEERRVGKEWRGRMAPQQCEKRL